MIANPQTLPTPKKPLPFTLHKVQVVQATPCDFQKRYYKYIHHLTLKPKTPSSIKKMSMPKTLHSLSLDSVVFNTWMPDQNLPVVKKLVKPYRKYLRYVQGGATDHPKIKKLLPFLARLEVKLAKEAFRRMTFHSNVKNLRFEMAFARIRRIPGEADELLMKYKARISRGLAMMKGLTALSMSVSREIQAANVMLEIIEKNISLDSLKELSLSFSSHLNPADFQTSISKIGERLTHLSIESLAWYSFLSSSGSLTNLSVLKLKLELRLISGEIDWGLLQFQNLSKLNKFSLDFIANSPFSETNFFENLTLPPSTEDFTLTLTDFPLSLTKESQAMFLQFFNRLQKAKRMKSLSLRINEKAENPSHTAKFARLLIKCFENLEMIHFTNLKTIIYGSNSKAEPLDFQAFWAAVGNSKETLKTVEIIANGINFPEKITALETGFPKLKKLYLGENVSSGVELGRFCQKISSLREITLKGVILTEEEKLKMFLDDMKEIPKGANFELNLDVGWMKQELLIDCLKRFIEGVDVKGKLGVKIKEVEVEDIKAFGEILKLVVKKRCFEPFSLMTKNYQTLFFVSKTKICQAVNGVILK